MRRNETNFPLNNIDNIHQFEALFNFATIGIIVTNNEGKIINYNKYAETQFGYYKEEILGKVVDALLPASTRKACKISGSVLQAPGTSDYGAWKGPVCSK